MRTHLIIVKLLAVILGSFCVRNTNATNESCWVDDDMCNVRAEISQNVDFSNGIAMDIDCLVSSEATEPQPELTLSSGGEDHHHHQQQQQQQQQHQYLLQRRFMGIQSVMLDGCQTPLNTHTYGLEFLPICANVTRVALRHFHMDALIPLQCGSSDADQQLELEFLQLLNNEIASIDGNSFQGNYPHLRMLQLESNSLKTIEGSSLRALRSLEDLRIVNEPVLLLKSPDLFEYTAVIDIHLEALKQMTSAIFRHLPETVQSIYVAYTQFDSAAVVVNNARALRNLTLANCALEMFTLCDRHSTITTISLNGNALKSFVAHENHLKELDLSNNQLDHFDGEWLTNLTELEVLSLKGNRIKTVTIYEILQLMPKGVSLDLRDNGLQSLQDGNHEFPSWLSTQVRIRCDQNPWDCLWLHDFAHAHPEKFRILHYDKFISKINVNGLECIPAEKPLEPQVERKKQESHKFTGEPNLTRSPDKVVNMSTYHVVYGDPWDFKRNQRAEALIIVFMLPVGIAFLFLLLYMWIYCQKMFHLSYYKNFSCVRRQPPVPNPSQRFDVVRQLPLHLQSGDPTRTLTVIHDQEEPGYEVPLNGLCSECNCKPLPNSLVRCNKAIHITYEESPTETAHQLYEEIIGFADNDQSEENYANSNRSPHLNYDHLRFE